MHLSVGARVAWVLRWSHSCGLFGESLGGGYLAAWDQSLGRAQRQGLSVSWGHPRSHCPPTGCAHPFSSAMAPQPRKVVPLQPHLRLTAAYRLSCFECSVLAVLPASQRPPPPSLVPHVVSPTQGQVMAAPAQLPSLTSMHISQSICWLETTLPFPLHRH